MPKLEGSQVQLRRHGDEMQRLPGGLYAALGRTDDNMNLGGIKVQCPSYIPVSSETMRNSIRQGVIIVEQFQLIEHGYYYIHGYYVDGCSGDV